MYLIGRIVMQSSKFFQNPFLLAAARQVCRCDSSAQNTCGVIEYYPAQQTERAAPRCFIPVGGCIDRRSCRSALHGCGTEYLRLASSYNIRARRKRSELPMCHHVRLPRYH